MSFCPQCDGPGNFLGSLGTLDHFRCRNCGWTYSESAEMPDDEDDGLSDMEADAMTLASAGWGTDEDYYLPNDGEGFFEGRDDYPE